MAADDVDRIAGDDSPPLNSSGTLVAAFSENADKPFIVVSMSESDEPSVGCESLMSAAEDVASGKALVTRSDRPAVGCESLLEGSEEVPDMARASGKAKETFSEEPEEMRASDKFVPETPMDGDTGAEEFLAGDGSESLDDAFSRRTSSGSSPGFPGTDENGKSVERRAGGGEDDGNDEEARGEKVDSF